MIILVLACSDLMIGKRGCLFIPPTQKLNPLPRNSKKGIGPLVRSALLMWARTGPQGIIFAMRAALRVLQANRRRHLQEEKLGVHIPTVMAISPTLRCNYNCRGCYSRSRSEDGEMSAEALDNLLKEAVDLGFLAVLITGGEPFLRAEIPSLLAKHKSLLFIIISNGSKVSNELSKAIAKSGNTLVLISVEGFSEQTDSRRGEGAHETALKAITRLRRFGVPVGFSVTSHAKNISCLGSEAFIDRMISLGCITGLFSEYVPCGPDIQPEWVLDEEQREAFHQQVLLMRARKPIVLVQFPQDEYGEANRCTAAGQASLHINPRGGVEPCPFVAVSIENVIDKGLIAAIHSPFFRAIRERPHLLKRQKYACSLFEHLPEIQELAEELS